MYFDVIINTSALLSSGDFLLSLNKFVLEIVSANTRA